MKIDTAFSLSGEVKTEMDKRRGDIPRSTWLENELRKLFRMKKYQRG